MAASPAGVGADDYPVEVVTALYRRYRPENFAELIGQTQVTDPLRTALRTDRVNHAYLFSGPRGCGKTTSARILARCLNCAEGPTDTPCGTCPSCVELSRDGGGSLDVVEIDAASHNGVDDARDLRERAFFAPARDRFKIFILDEAHMVTPQGFNALLKIVEEPPEHVKFIFATTEPDKVIGTIRSRTHHYPFRLVPPAQMLDYLQQLIGSEGVEVQPGVLPLVVRAGGGSVRDTLSLLDQLIAGSEAETVEYERAVALLGYTHAALLDEVVEALGSREAPTAFAAIDRVIQTGQDPRRFVEDLLERLRDLIVVAATRENAAAVLRGVPADELERMQHQAAAFGQAELSRAADVVNASLTEMTGATSPRLHLELLAARLLVPTLDDAERGALARVERLERRIGIEGTGSHETESAAATRLAAARPAAAPAASPAPAASAQPLAPPVPSAGAERPAAMSEPTPEPEEPALRIAEPVVELSPPPASDEPANPPHHRVTRPEAPAEVGPVSLQQVRDAWPEILEVVEKAKRSAWMVVFTSQARALVGDVLTLSFPSERDVASFKEATTGAESTSELLRRAILDVLGVRVKFIARVETAAGGGPALPPSAAPAPRSAPASAAAAPQSGRPDAARGSSAAPARTGSASSAPATAARGQAAPAPADAATPEAAPVLGWHVAAIPQTDADAPPSVPEPEPEDLAPADLGSADLAPARERTAPATTSPATTSPASASAAAASTTSAPRRRPAPPAPAPGGRSRYGEAVVRELLGASFIEEQTIAPAVRPVAPGEGE